MSVVGKIFRTLNHGESAGDSKQHAAELEAARDVRVRAWRYVFDCYAKKRAEHASEPGEITPSSVEDQQRRPAHNPKRDDSSSNTLIHPCVERSA